MGFFIYLFFLVKLWRSFYGSGSDRIGQSEKFDEYNWLLDAASAAMGGRSRWGIWYFDIPPPDKLPYSAYYGHLAAHYMRSLVLPYSLVVQ
jgi:hypothetical protein